MGCSPWCYKESDTTGQLNTAQQLRAASDLKPDQCSGTLRAVNLFLFGNPKETKIESWLALYHIYCILHFLLTTPAL